MLTRRSLILALKMVENVGDFEYYTILKKKSYQFNLPAENSACPHWTMKEELHHLLPPHYILPFVHE
jgi:hypothetical protein